MTTMFRAALIAGLALVGSLSLAPRAQACKCMMPSPQQAKENAAAVFEGRVTEIQHQAAGGASGIGFNLVTLKLVRTWKGVNELETVQVRTSDSSASCGIMFEKDTSYLVYAAKGEQGLEAGSCGRTMAMEAASEDLTVLGGGVTPVKVDPKPAETKAEPPKTKSGGCGSTKAAASASLPLMLPVVGLVLARRRRR